MGLQEKIAAQAQKKRRQRHEKIAGISSLVKHCINFSLLTEKGLFSEVYGETWGLSHFALVIHHATG